MPAGEIQGFALGFALRLRHGEEQVHVSEVGDVEGFVRQFGIEFAKFPFCPAADKADFVGPFELQIIEPFKDAMHDFYRQIVQSTGCLPGKLEVGDMDIVDFGDMIFSQRRHQGRLAKINDIVMFPL